MNDLINKYKNLNLPGQIIVIQVGLWGITQLGRLIHFPWMDYLSLPGAFVDYISKPWTLISYMWFHADLGVDVFHIIFNMMWLWYFGQFFLQYHTNRQLLTTLFWGGICGGIAFLCLSNGHLVGASGAIFALVAAVAIRQPNEPIYLNLFVQIVPVKMKWFAVIALGINILHLMGDTNTGGIICHLGGMLYGALFELNLRYQWTRTLFSRKPKMTAMQGGKRAPRPEQHKDIDYNLRQKEQQERIDAILDKISRSGYDGLTAEEKAALFDASQRKKH